MTTGAFYVYFRKKEDLFSAVVESELPMCGEALDVWLEYLTSCIVREEGGERAAVESIMDRRDLFRLLFDCSQGTAYESFKDQLLAGFEAAYRRVFGSCDSEVYDSGIAHLFACMKFAQYREMICGEYDREQVLCIIDWLDAFAHAGLESLKHSEE